MTSTLWIDEQYDVATPVGSRFFLISHTHHNQRGRTTYVLRDRPAHTNQSIEPRLHDWCGETNNVSTHACGIWEVVRIAKNGRLFVAEVTDRSAMQAFLDEHGYPDLMPAEEL